MNAKHLIVGVGVVVSFAVSGAAEAAKIGIASGSIVASRYATFEGMLTADHGAGSITKATTVGGLGDLSQYDAVITMPIEYGGLNATEIANMTAFINDGGKALLMGEYGYNGSPSVWHTYDASIDDVVDEDFIQMRGGVSQRTPTASHALLNGVTTVQSVWGNNIPDPTASSYDHTRLFEEAGVYTIGDGEALLLGDFGMFSDDLYIGKTQIEYYDNAVFAQNVSLWLDDASSNEPDPDDGEDAGSSLPAPFALGLMGVGLAGLGAAKKRR